MNKQITYLSVLSSLITLSACSSPQKKAYAEYEKDSGVRIPISVTSFRNKSAATHNENCHDWYWFSDLGSSFSELTVDELMNYKRFTVLERNDIQDIHDNEVNLINSEKTAPIEKGNFVKAKYTVSGVVNSFEYCSGKSNIGAAVSLLSSSLIGAGYNHESATVQVTLRLIDTKTGKIVASNQASGKQSRNSIAGLGEMKDFKVGVGNYSQSSLSDAIRDAIDEALNGLLKKADL